MSKLLNFYRNVTFFEEYDENSFIGRWLDYSEWNDEEYWKLEHDLLKIAEIYRITHEVYDDVLIGLMRIIELLMVSDWTNFIVSSGDNIDIYDRYERFKYIIANIFIRRDIILDDFLYRK